MVMVVQAKMEGATVMRREKIKIGFNFRVVLIFLMGGVYFNSDWVDFKWVCHVISYK